MHHQVLIRRDHQLARIGVIRAIRLVYLEVFLLRCTSVTDRVRPTPTYVLDKQEIPPLLLPRALCDSFHLDQEAPSEIQQLAQPREQMVHHISHTG
jgi:hypothetical protein